MRVSSIAFYITFLINILWEIFGKRFIITIIFIGVLSGLSFWHLLLIPVVLLVKSLLSSLILEIQSYLSTQAFIFKFLSSKDGFTICSIPDEKNQSIKQELNARSYALRKLNIDYDEVNIKILIPKNRKERIAQTPASYPNYINFSYIIMPWDLAKNPNNPLHDFLLSHEIQHCTSHSLMEESKKISSIVYTFIGGIFLLMQPIEFNLVITIIIFFALFFLLRMKINYSNIIETQTDMRALAMLKNKNEIVNVITFLKKFYIDRLKYEETNKVIFEYQLFGIKTIESSIEIFSSDDLFQKTIKKIGKRDLVGPFFSIPLTIIAISIGLQLNKINPSSTYFLITIFVFCFILILIFSLLRLKVSKQATRLISSDI